MEAFALLLETKTGCNFTFSLSHKIILRKTLQKKRSNLPFAFHVNDNVIFYNNANNLRQMYKL